VGLNALEQDLVLGCYDAGGEHLGSLRRQLSS
jgi:hypothetical protein